MRFRNLVLNHENFTLKSFLFFPRTLLEVWLWIRVDSDSPRTSTLCLSHGSSCRVTPLSKVSTGSVFNESGVVVWMFFGFAHKAFCNRSFVFVFAYFFSLSPLSSPLRVQAIVQSLTPHAPHNVYMVFINKAVLLKGCENLCRWFCILVMRLDLNANMLICEYSAIMVKMILFVSISSTDCNKYAYNSSFMRLLHQMRLHRKSNPH